jgi:adenine-specific DNA-methyltransferase
LKKLDLNDVQTPPAITTAANILAIEDLLPEAFSEGRINFDVLKQLLGGTVVDSDEKYGLTWHGKRQARQLALTPSLGTLRPSKDESVDWDTTRNMMIEGDNLEVLRLLQKSLAGKVKAIYIDPPYNTGKDFVYRDSYKDSISNYKSLTGQTQDGVVTTSNTEAGGRFHTNWLQMIYPRLKVARGLLREDGVIMISIDDGEFANLRHVMDELFGEENFAGTIVVETATDNNPSQISVEHEYIVVYARHLAEQDDWERPSEKAPLIKQQYSALKTEFGDDLDQIQGSLRAWIKTNRASVEGLAHYDNVDEKGVFHDGDIANTKFGGYSYEVIHPVTGRVCKIPEKGFRFPKNTLDRMIADGDIMFGDDETTLIKPKKRLENARELLRSVMYEDGRAATKRLDSILARGVFNNPKSELTLARLFDFVTEPGDLVLDFFAGSGTAGHAALLRRDGGCRFVLVQLPELLDPSQRDQKAAADFCDAIERPRTIAEITKERLRRVSTAIKRENPEFKGDLGFRVFKLDSSNIRAWQPQPADVEQLIIDSTDHIVPGRSEQDLLFELLVKLGYDLCAPMIDREIAGKTVRAIEGGRLIACLAESITRVEAEPLAEGIAQWHATLSPVDESMCVFRDSAFEDDVAKTNLTMILEQRGLANVRSV